MFYLLRDAPEFIPGGGEVGAGAIRRKYIV
jgi:hypothetical protein